VASGFSITLSPKADLIVPLNKNIAIPLGVFGFILLSYFVIVGTSNAVNLTDGLDGLAIMPAVMVAGGLAVFAMVIGRVDYSRYLLYPYIPGAAELTIFCGALVGAGLGFSGGTPTRRTSSWATWARSRWAQRWHGRDHRPPGDRALSSWAACSSRKQSR